MVTFFYQTRSTETISLCLKKKFTLHYRLLENYNNSLKEPNTYHLKTLGKTNGARCRNYMWNEKHEWELLNVLSQKQERLKVMSRRKLLWQNLTFVQESERGNNKFSAVLPQFQNTAAPVKNGVIGENMRSKYW